MHTSCIRKLQQDQQIKRHSHLHFCWDVALGLIAGFSSHKCKAEASAYVGPVMPINEATHDSVHMGLKQTRRCKWHSMQKMGRKNTMYGCKLCGVHLCKEGCHYAYHHQ